MRPIVVFWLAVICAHAQVTAITDVTVIDPGTSAVRPHMTVVIDGKQIRSIQPAVDALPRRARRIEGAGKYLIPGLQDSHVHLTKLGIGSLPLFVANGVTSVRDMGSDLAEVAAWRSKVQAGQLVGPRITTSGQILESAANVARMKKAQTIEPVERIRMPLANADEARLAVQKLKAGGADHVKMRTTPDLATFQAAAAEANRLGLPFTMHGIASPEDMIGAGVRSVEHFLAVPPLDTMSGSDRKLLFDRMSKSGMVLSTTIVNIDGSILIPYDEAKRRVDDRGGAIDPWRKYVCGYVVDDWREQVEERKGGAYDELLKLLPGLYRDIRDMREAGVLIVAGTDAGVAFMYPGFSMHDELAMLVKHAAFSPMDVLRSATYSAAKFNETTQQRGSIAPGQSADLVLLNENPLSDIRNTTRIRGVMAQGRWFDREALDRLLKQSAEACAQR